MVLGNTVWRLLSILMAGSEGSECNHHQCVYATSKTPEQSIINPCQPPLHLRWRFQLSPLNEGYSKSNNDGTCLVEWASANNLTLLYNQKEPDNFHSACWNSGTNPALAFVSSTEDQPPPTRRVLEKFPRSQHWPSLITTVPPVAPTLSKPVRRWNFRKADWDKFKLLTKKATRTLPALDNKRLGHLL